MGEAEVVLAARLRPTCSSPIRSTSRSGPPSGCAAWRERGRVAIGVDSVEGAAAGRPATSRRTGVEVVVEVDSGQHRTGCPPEDAGSVAVAAARAGLTVRGVFTFPGHSYAPDAMATAAADEARALATARAAVEREGLEVVCRQRRFDTELRPSRHRCAHRGPAGRLRLRRRPAVGARQHAAGVDRADLPRHRGQPWPGAALVLDAGSKALGRRPRGVQHRLRPAARPPGGADRPALRAPRRGRPRRGTAPPGRQPARRRPEPRAAPRSTSPTTCGSRSTTSCGPGRSPPGGGTVESRHALG